MSKAAVTSHGSGLGPDQHSPEPEEVRRQLHSILASPAFHGSKRCQKFLEYVCEASLAGGVGTMKERTIATEVFGRHPDSDLGEDTIVRVGAREVRKRLAQYYVTPEGAAAEVRIDLPPGRYAPEFRHAAALKEEEAPPHVAVEPLKPLPRARRWRLVTLCAGLVVTAVSLVIVAKVTGANPNADAFNRFWEPAFRSHEPFLLAVAHPIVYHPSRRAVELSDAGQPPAGPMQRAIQVPAKELDGSDLIPVFNQYVGFGDLVAATEISAMMARRSKNVQVRMSSGLPFADLRNAQALLIGAVSNRWTMEMQPAWRFQFARTPESRTVIVDTMDGGGGKAGQEHRQWSIPAMEDGSSPEDYILICRMRNSVTGALLMVAAGLKQFGTEAAGRLLADPDQLGLILRKLPSGWEAKNLQLVLHARVLGNTAAQPEVVAWHVW